MTFIIKNIYIFCQFYFKLFFTENTYKFYYEKNFAEIFFYKIFRIKYFS